MMQKKNHHLFPRLESFVRELSVEFELIPKERKALLNTFADYVLETSKSNDKVALNFICTHNSRRSHISQICAAAAAAHFGIEQIVTYSGGTEATAFNHRAVAAMERVGFQIKNPGGENPRYHVYYSDGHPPLECFSKTFDDPFNPQHDFAAIMTCSQADENCPFIPGAGFRLALTYEDPKEADDTSQEKSRYDERVRQIGREIFFAMNQVRIGNE